MEAIHTRLVGSDKRAAAIAALKEYAWPLIAGTFTTISVFIPLFFLSGVTGKFIASIPFTIIFVLLASIFVALGLVPLIAMYTIRGELSPMEKRQELWNEKAAAWYEKFLRRILGNRRTENRFLIGIMVLFIVALMLPAFGAVQSEFFPADDSDIVTIEIERPQGTELSQTDLSVREVEELLYADKRIESLSPK